MKRIDQVSHILAVSDANASYHDLPYWILDAKQIADMFSVSTSTARRIMAYCDEMGFGDYSESSVFSHKVLRVTIPISFRAIHMDYYQSYAEIFLGVLGRKNRNTQGHEQRADVSLRFLDRVKDYCDTQRKNAARI